jgi:phospholipase/carboxylesterase
MKLKFILHSILFSCFLLFNHTATAQKINSDLTYVVQEPKKKSERVPVLIMLHGYGSNESDLFAMAQSFDERYLVLSVRGPFNGKDMGYSWYNLNFLPDKKITHDFEQAKESSFKLRSFISEACKVYKADSNRVILMGFSQGAVMAFHMGISYPGKIYGLIALSGRMMEESKSVKTDAKKLQELKVFMAHGYSDNVIDYKEAEKAHNFLKEKQVKQLTFKSYEMPHSICGAKLKDIQGWLKKQADPEVKKQSK